MAVEDNALQSLLGELRFGKDIGGTNPTPGTFGVDQSNTPYARFFSDGPAWANFLWAVHRPIFTKTGKVQLQFMLTIDSSVLVNGQCLEFDTILGDGQREYNMSSQINMSIGNMLQLSDVNGNWQDTGFQIKMPKPGIPTRFIYDYAFDFAKMTYGTRAVTIAGTKYTIPPQFQGLTPIKRLWEFCSLQVQLDTNGKGGPMQHTMTDVKYIWA